MTGVQTCALPIFQKLLKENPDLDKKLHDLNLQPQFYGEVSNQQIANNTAANTTANSTQ